jgi:D-glycero-alpha-D-manno-heptose-7-phosphate kinase
LAFQIEKIFNPLAGMQDIYGCGIGGFKKIFFEKNKPPSFKFLDSSFITNSYEMYLLNTNIVRNSTDILKTLDVDKSYPLLDLVNEFENHICNKNTKEFFNLFNSGWEIKKTTSKNILNNENICLIDKVLSSLDYVKGYKLCGAGGGGYFLVFVNKNNKKDFETNIGCNLSENQLINVNVDTHGIRGFKL